MMKNLARLEPECLLAPVGFELNAPTNTPQVAMRVGGPNPSSRRLIGQESSRH